MPRKKKNKYPQIELIFLVIAAVLILVLWRTPFIFPIKLFSVLVHEIGHAFAVIISGGEVLYIQVGANLGGETLFKGGSGIIVALAGYLASVLIGGLAFFSSYKEKQRKYFSFTLALLLFLFIVNFVKEPFSIAVSIIYCLIFTIVPLLKNKKVGEYSLRFFGLTAAIYVFTDVLQDVFPSSIRVSDAEILENLTGVPSIFWGILWLVASGLTIYSFYSYGIRRSFAAKK